MLVVELFVGLGWTRAAAEKIIDANWWTGDALREFVADHAPVAIGWYEPFLVRVVAPHVVLVAVTVVALQLFAGAALLIGRNRTAGLIIGMFLSLHFLAAGAVNPSAFYLLAQGAVLLAIAEASHARIEAVLGTVKFVSGTSAFVSVAFIRTLHPATVIDDPAAMFVTLGILTVLACELVRWRRLAANRLGVDRLATVTSERPTVAHGARPHRTPLPDGPPERPGTEGSTGAPVVRSSVGVALHSDIADSARSGRGS